MIGLSAALMLFDIKEFTFTVSDIVNEKGSDAVRYLRHKADKYEAFLPDL